MSQAVAKRTLGRGCVDEICLRIWTRQGSIDIEYELSFLDERLISEGAGGMLCLAEHPLRGERPMCATSITVVDYITRERIKTRASPRQIDHKCLLYSIQYCTCQ